jgi:prophage regulatory protein
MKHLSGKEVEAKTSLSRVTIWRMEQRGEFPQRVQISLNRVGWIESEVDEWMQARPRVGVAEYEVSE